jgi:hypothetical protein
MDAWMGLWLGLGSKNFSGVCRLGCSVREIADLDVGEQSDLRPDGAYLEDAISHR